jgi:hypothetical protein
MAAPTIAPISVSLEDFSGSDRAATPALLSAMLRAAEKISDLIFSPGRPPQVQVYGQMIPVQVPGFTVLTPDDTRHIAADLIGDTSRPSLRCASTGLATFLSAYQAWPAFE